MRVLAIPVLLVCSLGQAQTARYRGNVGVSQQNQPQTADSTPDKPTPIPKKPDTPQPQPKTAEQQPSDGQKPLTIVVNVPPSTHDHDWIDFSVLAINALLAVITGAGVIAAWKGLPEIWRQAKATEETALAAKKSADAQINIERPWLLIEGLKLPRFTATTLDAVRRLQGTLQYRITNYGKTPARVRACEIRLALNDSAVAPPNPNSVFNASDSFVNPHIIPQGDKREGTVRCLPNSPLTSKEDAKVIAGTAFLWAYGLVRYEDVHGGFYETRVCYRYDTDCGRLMLDGPAEYNNAT